MERRSEGKTEGEKEERGQGERKEREEKENDERRKGKEQRDRGRGEGWKKRRGGKEREIISEKLNYKYTMNPIHVHVLRHSLAVSLTCEQLAILLMGSPTLGHHATSLTQSVWASSFSSRTQLSLSSL